MSEDFNHLHVHSDYSMLAGCATMSQYCQVAKERGHKAIAFTEYGTQRGISELINVSKSNDLKPVFGIEFYVCGNMRRRGLTPEEREAILAGVPRSRWSEVLKEYEDAHGISGGNLSPNLALLTCWAATNAGLKNMFKLSSRAWIDGFYYKPRIDLDELIKLNDGLMIGTGCPESVIHSLIAAGRRKRALEVADQLWEVFGPERMWLELMPHSLLKHNQANEFTMELAKRWGKKARLLATQDAHYINKGDHQYQRMLAAIGDNRSVEECGLPGEDFWFKTRAEMAEGFKEYHSGIDKADVKRALDNTVAFADQITTTLGADRFQCIIPPVYVPPEHEGDEFQFLKRLCVEGWRWREIPRRAAEYAKAHKITLEESMALYSERLKMELGALKRQKFVVYILFVRELYEWVRAQDIACGPGRGSAAGSLVNFLVGITSVDPVEHGLLFERFISPQRIDMPDIDMDFEDVRRDEILQHLRDKYGTACAVQVATIGKLKGKACIRDVSRVLKIPRMEVDPVTKAILERSSGDERASMTIEDSFKEFQVCVDFDKKYPQVLQYARKLEGMTRSLGIHAAGVVAAPEPLENILPLESRDHAGVRVPVTAVDFWGAEGFGLLKLDVLALRTMTVLRMARDAVRDRHGILIDYEKLSLNERDVLQGFTAHDYVGVFQYDSPGADKICAGVNFTHFEDVAAMTALNRPGTARSGLATHYVARKKDPSKIADAAFHPAVSAITSDTLGIIVYQEHVIKIFTEIAGFEPGTADSLRKKIAKKAGDEALGKESEAFIEGAMKKTGMSRKEAAKIMEAITFFGSYGFNKSHATAYGMIAYWCMYMKIRHPLEFFWALLTCEPVLQRIQTVAKDAKRHKVKVLPPDVSVSGDGFRIDAEGSIRGSLSDIKGVGTKASQSIMEHQPYTSFEDFMSRVDRRKVNKGTVIALIKSGAMMALVPNTKWFIDHTEDLWRVITKGKGGLAKVQDLVARSKDKPDYAKEERVLVAASVSPLAFGKHPIDAYKDFMKRNVKVPIVSMGAEDFYERNDSEFTGGVFIAGIIVEIKLNQVGDFHTGAEPDAAEKARMGWGKRYANINIEDSSGRQNRVKFDWDIYDDVRHLVDAGIGTPLIIHASVNAKFTSIKAHFAISLEEYRKRVKAGAELIPWERVIAGKHPALDYPWKSEANAKYARKDLDVIRNDARRLAKQGDGRDVVVFRVIGIVTHVKTKPDKKGKIMGFFGILGVKGYIDVAAWGSVWPSIKKHVKVGQLIDIELEYGGWSSVYNGDRFRVLTAKASTKE